jgi:nucleoside recognition membrane protein YjiH
MSNNTTSPATARPPVVVPVKSPFESKTNWIMALTAILDLLNEVLPIVPDKYQHTVSLAITVIGAVLGIISKTFFTTTVSSLSVPNTAPSPNYLATVLRNAGVPETKITDALNAAQLPGAR